MVYPHRGSSPSPLWSMDDPSHTIAGRSPTLIIKRENSHKSEKESNELSYVTVLFECPVITAVPAQYLTRSVVLSDNFFLSLSQRLLVSLLRVWMYADFLFDMTVCLPASVRRSAYVSLSVSSLSVCLPIYPFVLLSVCLSVLLSVHPFVLLSVCLAFSYSVEIVF